MRPATFPWLVGLLLAVMIGQGVAVGARLADERSTSGRPGDRPAGSPGEGVPSDEARAELCGEREAPTPVSPPGEGAGLPEPLRPIADAVAEIRRLEFLHPVSPEPITREEMAERVAESVDKAYPRDLLERRTRVWRAIGVIPPGADLAREIPAFSTSSIVGYYDTITKDLVYIGTDDPTPLQQLTLAHELGHALDDQHFDLSRLDALDAACADDAVAAAVGIAEGSAVLVERLFVDGYLTDEEYHAAVEESLGGPGTPEVSPFLIDLLYWPYRAGEVFVQRVVTSGGFEGLDRALARLPASTEQILHPSRFPDDAPTDVDAPDASVALEGTWAEIDVYDAGEAFLRLALELRLSEERAAAASTGWDGGEYRAWSNEAGDRIAVVLDTVWDGPGEAKEFLSAMRTYLQRTASGTRARAVRTGARVVVLWATDAGDLEEMAAAVGAA